MSDNAHPHPPAKGGVGIVGKIVILVVLVMTGVLAALLGYLEAFLQLIKTHLGVIIVFALIYAIFIRKGGGGNS